MGEPLTLSTPFPFLTVATATEFFFLPKHWVRLFLKSDMFMVIIKPIKYLSIQYYYLHLHMEEKVKVLTLKNQDNGTEDRYALGLNPIGQGKYAKVYKAINMINPTKVFAVKVIRIESEQVRKEYLKELRIIQNLPPCVNLVKTHKQHLESQNNLYIFQEFCQGGTLMSIRTEKLGAALSQEQAYDLFYQLSNGLITLLEAGIVHEDIKPVNILKRGKVFKLCDFGVSQIQAQCKESTTRKGTISYMPPQKLKSRRFLPNEKSDIYSLGTCIYEIIFGFHPYLKKKTANYKEYLQALEQATLRPIPILMKKIGSSSLRLENFLKFLERMIDLNQKTRATLADLKDFIRTTQPFKFMSIPEETQEVREEDRQSYAQNFKLLQESIIRYTKNTEDQMSITSQKPKNTQQIPQIPNKQTEALFLKQKLRQKFKQQNLFLVNALGFLFSGIVNIRKSNFCQMNLLNVGKNIANVDLSDCKQSRYLKYLAFEFSQAVRKRQEERYAEHLSEDVKESLEKDRSYLNNEFNKFLIESSFAKKAEFAQALQLFDPLELWRQISAILEESLRGMSIVKENKKPYLLSILLCCHMPKLLQTIASIRTIFGSKPVQQQLTESYLGETDIETGRNLLMEVVQISTERIEKVREAVERELQHRELQVLFEIEESSGEIEVIEEKDLQ